MGSEKEHKDFMLAALRAASLRVRTMEEDINTIGIALKGGVITPETAVKWLKDAGLSFLVFELPEKGK